jgi:hypothetical protein
LSTTNDTVSNIKWRVNDSSVEELSGVTPIFLSRIRVGRLEFTMVPIAYNMTTIQCRAELNSNQTLISNYATLRILGEVATIMQKTMVKVAYYDRVPTYAACCESDYRGNGIKCPLDLEPSYTSQP